MTDMEFPWKGKLPFDEFVFYTRISPAAVCVLPFLLTSVLKLVTSGFDWENIFLVVFFVGAVAFGTNVVRKLGRKQEAKLYERLGAIPTTIIQRFSDNRISSVSKQQYHANLNKIYGLKLPLSLDEERPEDDEKYRATTDKLRNYTFTNRAKYPRVYQELKEYNFCRNLYGLKWYAIFVYALCAIAEIYKLFRSSISIQSVYDVLDILVKPSGSAASVYVYIIAIILLLLFVRSSAMEDRAFDYAKALIEVCEGLDEDSSIFNEKT